MTIDTNELRRKVNSTDVVDHIDLHANVKPFLSELIDRLEAAEKERGSATRLADSLALALNTSNHERDNLQAKIEAMEQQEPVAWMGARNGFICKDNKNTDYNMPLYLAPGAKGE